ncbi:hypothetical protein A3K48_04770 [candidate division WOR-1 bacterium RIFOXYA12_FULL_52_29]|uniref:FlgD Ig-like domain-containing protein n=1 Tax=candidate division WOR-1 bacterium RIFOXYC12_FULL_54_18 TaxID=1802584 RepID=A0A1F4T6T1_UNCSA|nr:MAG: hypothetical protein A3K44_04770 [candidate division WOR-1 bacterium RIFOXYA2_FULL_51_19]OGC17860.1 MAG: hypothetical protein A3K48_04770 [candidate division WOR-1 bacterium RIFOXYA12_FULL_52_29]OGC26717.1 MAG: hypothetical protein A3K32_04765 [candidate division WOR-1 bacterium RIFOXYB2_FULL_45_9]OGC28277.1 MAG: hypothetical protein A3K49_04770 [candidate division WOR-1 bacterium RIFOXYC12_FULL_54_18]OGC31265.1 MAG: hypothetical protein A2346_07850 [candidate division WOR-1 bacterium R
MKRLALIIGLLVLTSAAFAQVATPATQLKFMTPGYWVVGNCPDAKSGAGADILADGRIVYFFENEAELVSGNYVTTTIYGTKFMVNAMSIWPAVLTVGKTYKVATERGPDNYGANPTDVTISGKGWDQVDLTLVLGGGISPPAGDAEMGMKIWFGNRLYQPALVEKGDPFIVSANPTIKVDLSVNEPHTLSDNVSDYTIILDPQSTSPKTYQMEASFVTSKTLASATELIRALSLKYTVTEPLTDGLHTFAVSAKTAASGGIQASMTKYATVEVMGGPLRLVGTPLTFPSPYSIPRHGTVTIQYGLSADANIEIYVIGVDGTRIKHFILPAATEGGSAGINKVTWDGTTDQGYKAGNAIYVGTIVARDEGRLLGKFKLTIVN